MISIMFLACSLEKKTAGNANGGGDAGGDGGGGGDGPNTVAPTPGGNIIFPSILGNAVQVSWPAASDNQSPASNLRYRLVKDNTSASNIDSLTKVDAKTGADMSLWTMQRVKPKPRTLLVV